MKQYTYKIKYYSRKHNGKIQRGATAFSCKFFAPSDEVAQKLADTLWEMWSTSEAVEIGRPFHNYGLE